MATNTKTFSNIKGGYRANGNAFTLLSDQVLSSTSAVKIHSVTITCGVGNAYGLFPYISDTTTGKTTQIGSYVKNGSPVNMLPDGGYFFYPSSSTTISSSELTKYTYENTEYYRLSGHASNFVYADGASTTMYATINGMNSASNITVSNGVLARTVRWGTVSGDSSRVIHGISPGTSGYAEKTLSFNTDTTQLAAGETFNLKVYCNGNGVLCIPSGSSVVVTYEEVEVDEPEIDTYALHGTITFEGLSSLPSSVTCQVYQTGTYHDERVTITGLTTEYSFSGYSPEDDYVIFPEIDGFTLTTIPSGDTILITETIPFSELIEDWDNDAPPHMQDGYIVPTEFSIYSVQECVEASSYSSLNYEMVDGRLRLYYLPSGFSGVSVTYYTSERNAVYTSANETTINVSGLSDNYDISINHTSSTETICLIDDSGSFAYIDWYFTSFDSPVSTISNSCGPTMSGGFKVPTNITSIDTVYFDNLSACFSCCIYNNDVYVSQDSSSNSAANIIISGFVQKTTITSNGTYTVEGDVTISKAYDNYFSENGTISYEDNNVINIEFREYRNVNIRLVDTAKSIGAVPPANNVLIRITYSNGTSQSLQTPYRTSVHPQYWGLSGLLTNTNAPGVTITSVLVGGIEVRNKSGITVTNSADYSITGQSSGIFPDFKGFSGTITFVNGTPPNTITCNRYKNNTSQGTVVINITDDVTNYSYGANIVQGEERLQFPELSGWTLTTTPSNTSNVLKKNATYTYNGPWKSVTPYVYITGTGWVKYEDTRVYNSSTRTWEQYDWKVYSEVVTTSNEYGETAEAALYDTIENDDGTTVIM